MDHRILLNVEHDGSLTPAQAYQGQGDGRMSHLALKLPSSALPQGTECKFWARQHCKFGTAPQACSGTCEDDGPLPSLNLSRDNLQHFKQIQQGQ